MCRKRISFISGFGAIVSHFVRGDIFFTHPVYYKKCPVIMYFQINYVMWQFPICDDIRKSCMYDSVIVHHINVYTTGNMEVCVEK